MKRFTSGNAILRAEDYYGPEISAAKATCEARAILAETEPDIFRASYLTLADLRLDLPRPAWTESLVESLAAILPVLGELEGEAGR